MPLTRQTRFSFRKNIFAYKHISRTDWATFSSLPYSYAYSKQHILAILVRCRLSKVSKLHHQSFRNPFKCISAPLLTESCLPCICFFLSAFNPGRYIIFLHAVAHLSTQELCTVQQLHHQKNQYFEFADYIRLNCCNSFKFRITRSSWLNLPRYTLL